MGTDSSKKDALSEVPRSEEPVKEESTKDSKSNKLDTCPEEHSGKIKVKLDNETKNALKQEDSSNVASILNKVKRLSGVKRVEFDPIPVTQEFKVKAGRRRRKTKEKFQLRVISKREWDGLRAEYIRRQKSHMAALKESLRELKQQDAQAQDPPASRHVDLEDVFGTKRLKPTQ